MLAKHILVSEKDAEDYIKRIAKIPDAIDQLMIFEKRRAEAGIYSPKFVYEKTLLQLTSLIETPTDQHPLFMSFKDASESMDLETDKKESMFLSLKDNIEKFKSSYARLKILVEENSQNAREFD